MSPSGLRFSTLSRNLVDDRVIVLGSNPKRVSMMFATSRLSFVRVRDVRPEATFGGPATDSAVALVTVVFTLSAEISDFASSLLWTLAPTVSRMQAVSTQTPDIDRMRRNLCVLNCLQPALIGSKYEGQMTRELFSFVVARDCFAIAFLLNVERADQTSDSFACFVSNRRAITANKRLHDK